MVWEVIEKGAERLTNEYPRFEEIGDYVEGNFVGLEEDDYNHMRIVLYIGTDEDDLPKYQYLPSHANLRKYNEKLVRGEYIRIELTKIIPSNNEKYNDKKIFKVMVDHSKDVEFGEDNDE